MGLLRLEFLSGFSIFIFPFYRMLFMKIPKFSWFAGFFVRIMKSKTREEYGFL